MSSFQSHGSAAPMSPARPEQPQESTPLISPEPAEPSTHILPPPQIKRHIQPFWFTTMILLFRIFSAYISIVVFLMYCAMAANYVINLTFLGWDEWASKALSDNNGPASGTSGNLGLWTPAAWTYNSIVLSSSVMLIYDAVWRAQYFGFVRTVVLPTLFLMPIGFLINLPGRMYLRWCCRTPERQPALTKSKASSRSTIDSSRSEAEISDLYTFTKIEELRVFKIGAQPGDLLPMRWESCTSGGLQLNLNTPEPWRKSLILPHAGQMALDTAFAIWFLIMPFMNAILGADYMLGDAFKLFPNADFYSLWVLGALNLHRWILFFIVVYEVSFCILRGLIFEGRHALLLYWSHAWQRNADEVAADEAAEAAESKADAQLPGAGAKDGSSWKWCCVPSRRVQRVLRTIVCCCPRLLEWMIMTYGFDVFDDSEQYIRKKGERKVTRAAIMWQKAFKLIKKHRIAEGQLLDGCRWISSTPYLAKVHESAGQRSTSCRRACAPVCTCTAITGSILLFCYVLMLITLNIWQHPLNDGKKSCSIITPMLGGFFGGMVLSSIFVWLVCRWELVFSRSTVCTSFSVLAVLSVAVVSITQVSTCGNQRPANLEYPCFYPKFYMQPTAAMNSDAAKVAACAQSFGGLSVTEASVLAALVAHLTASHCISLHLSAPHSISVHLTPSHCISLHLTASHPISLHLTASHHLTPSHSISLHLTPPHPISLQVLTALVAHLEPSPLLINVTRTLFPGWEYAGGALAGSMPMFYEFYNKQANTSVIVIQGSSTLGDAYFDLQIWCATLDLPWPPLASLDLAARDRQK